MTAKSRDSIDVERHVEKRHVTYRSPSYQRRESTTQIRHRYSSRRLPRTHTEALSPQSHGRARTDEKETKKKGFHRCWEAGDPGVQKPGGTGSSITHSANIHAGSSQLRPLFATEPCSYIQLPIAPYEGKGDGPNSAGGAEKKCFFSAAFCLRRRPSTGAVRIAPMSAVFQDCFFFLLHLAAGAAGQPGCAHGEASLVLLAGSFHHGSSRNRCH
jgi:hypothetical protein